MVGVEDAGNKKTPTVLIGRRGAGRGSTLLFHSKSQYRGLDGGHYPSHSRTHIPRALRRIASSRWRSLSVRFTQVLFPFIVANSTILSALSVHVKEFERKSFAFSCLYAADML